MKPNLKKIVPHLVVVLLLMGIALIYFYPVLQGKGIYQTDIVQYTGMAKAQNDFRAETKTEPYWTNSTFGGMPTYQLGAYYPYDYVKKLDRLIRFLPRPADYLFLYFVGFYVLLLVLKTDWRLAFLGALAFGLSTYLIIILGVGHNAKAHAIGYFPWVLSGIFLVFQRKYIWGSLLTAMAMALEINANHFQMTYYLLLLVLVIGGAYLVDAYRKKQLLHFFKSVGLLSIAVLLSLVVNATNLMATQEYAQWSTRSKSELSINSDGTPRQPITGLSKAYITEYSYGIAESFNLFAPRFMGGSSGEALGEGSKTYKFLVNQGVPQNQAKDFVSGLPMYWGDQAFIGAPAYVGAVVIFLCVLGLFLVKGPLKWGLFGGIILSLLLSWGKHFSLLTNAMIDYFPLYNKFRAVSSIQVILELCIPLLAMLGLAKILSGTEQREYLLKILKRVGLGFAVVIVLLFALKGMFAFEGLNDAYYRAQFTQMGLPQLMDIIILDRKAMYNKDLFRSSIFVLLAVISLWLFLRKKLKPDYVIVAFILFIVIDLVSINQNYVNEDDFVNSRLLEKPFQPTAADREILKDTAYFRVFEPALGLSGGRTSYFHYAIGGYHAAKSKRFQELYDFHIEKNNVGVLNMLNVKYIIQAGENGAPVALKNPFANGNAWFVDEVLMVETPDDEIQILDSLDTKSKTVINSGDLKGMELATKFEKDSTASIQLVHYQPNYIKYQSNNMHEGLAIFSEMYYPHGWKVSIDGQEAYHFRANYVLRALKIAPGKHTIEFRFQPDVVQKGSRIALAGSVLLCILFLGGVFYTFRPKKRMLKPEQHP